MQFLEKLKPLGLLVLRLALGASFMLQGYPKLSEPAHWLKAFQSYGFPSYFAYISGILEVFCGGLALSFAAHFVLTEVSQDPWMQILVSVVGIGLLIALAYLLAFYRKLDRGQG